MTTPATPERICNVLRERGIPAATVQQYRSLLFRANEELKLTVSRHLAKVASAVDDSQSIKWVSALSKIAKGEVVDTALFQELAPLVTVPGAPDSPGTLAPPVESNAPIMKTKAAPKKDAEQRAKERQTIHVYGAKAALCLELDRLRPDDAGREKATLTIEAALRRQDKTYGWKDKVALQLGLAELPAFLGAVMGWVPEWSVKAHGLEHDKVLFVKSQPGGVQILVAQRALGLSVPVTYADTYAICSLALKALLENDPHLSSDTALQLCRRACGGTV